MPHGVRDTSFLNSRYAIQRQH
ncbi:MAG: hypothetical protein JWQ94_4039, partial [Tardiphaga sp.]|nr:hypothetical protein [Tardiphaga sp.]